MPWLTPEDQETAVAAVRAAADRRMLGPDVPYVFDSIDDQVGRPCCAIGQIHAALRPRDHHRGDAVELAWGFGLERAETEQITQVNDAYLGACDWLGADAQSAAADAIIKEIREIPVRRTE